VATEKALEKYGASQAKQRGIFVIKLGVLGGGGWPDHSFFKGGRVAFIEYKVSESAKFQPLQKYYLKLLSTLGFRVAVCWTKDQVDQFLEGFDNEIQTSRLSRECAGQDDGAGEAGSASGSGDGQDGDLP
jgi:hypothetical protein